MTTRSVIWRRTDGSGTEHATLVVAEDAITLLGAVVTAEEGRPLTIRYRVECDLTWRTRSVIVDGSADSATTSALVQASSRGDGRWISTTMQGERVPLFTWNGCIDVDLGFSPITNLLPLRRLAPAIGESVDVSAAWIRFPGFGLKPLPQRYTRLAEFRYRYESFDPGYETEIDVDELGLVVRYGDVWERIAFSDGPKTS